MNYLATHLIYKYNDMSGLFLDLLAHHEKTDFINKFGLAYQQFFDYLSTRIIYFLASFIPPVLLDNLLIIVCLILVLLSSFLLFRQLTKNTPVSVLFSLFYAFSAYFISRVFSFTPPLYCTFVFPLIVYLLITKRSPLLVGLVTFLAFLLSSYYGFFAFVLVIFWLALANGKILLKLKNLGLFISFFLVLVALSFWQPLLSNIPFMGNTSITTVEKDVQAKGSSLVVYRPIENWYSFSFRPWYFFIPPKSSLVFGDISRQFYDRIAQTGYYLANNYSDDEMTGVFFGWHIYSGALFVLILLALQKYKGRTYKVFSTVYANKEIILKSALVFVLILLISGPPSITVHGLQIYTPSYLLYYLVPGFRTLVRWVAVLYLLILIVNTFLVLDLYALLKKSYQKALLLIGFFGLNFVITAVKLPVLNIANPPEEIAYLRDISSDKFSYAVYPKGDYASMFWLVADKKFLINPISFSGYFNEFDSAFFSQNLVTAEGINALRSMNARYLVFYPDKITKVDLAKIQALNSTILSVKGIENYFSSEFGDPIVFTDGAKVYRVN